MSLTCWHVTRSHARDAPLLAGAVAATVSLSRSSGAAVVSDLVGDADVMPGLGSVPLGRWQSAGEER